MAVITPNTDLYLLKVPLEINDINQLDFANATAQYNYFNSLPKIVVEDYTYQRKDNTIRFGANFDEIISYNYVMYRNTEYSDKWFYAFITNIEYVNDNMTMITIKTDVWQTWMFDLNFKPCMIEREHTNDDTVGANTLPENLELGEMVVNGNTVNFGGMSAEGAYTTVVDVSMLENSNTAMGRGTLTYWIDPPIPGVTYPIMPAVNGIPSGVVHILIPGAFSDPAEVIEAYNLAGLTDAVINCYIVPNTIIDYDNLYSLTIEARMTIEGVTQTKTVSGLKIFVESYDEMVMGTRSFSKPQTLDGYSPRNNKLKTFPFSYFNISNNAGSSFDYHYEDFGQNNPTFRIDGAFCPSCSIKAVPIGYKNIDANGNSYDYGITGAKYPIISWNSDSYTNWLTQNALNITMTRKQARLGLLTETLKGAGGGYSENGMAGGLVGAGLGLLRGVTNLKNQIDSEFAAKTEANFQADQVGGNANAGDVVYSKLRNNFTYLPMSIKAEYARCCDEYFDILGYATNRVKLPNITGRRNWNYVKTTGCYIEADIPQEDLAEIKGMFDRGITFWHNPLTFADYSQNNDII